MRYVKLHKGKVEENEHDFEVENKRASNDDQRVKRLVGAMQKILTTYKDRQWDLARNVRWSHRLAIPIDGLGQHMSPVEYRTILKYRLMIPLFPVDEKQWLDFVKELMFHFVGLM
ncbi:hypothetical protein HanXRQr2_Chr08g0328661 [Helianthus annuus]|uniref:Uncharacterized protein n=1 Tax=Helianthus annuus TaxID=4232 RepID=A0A9K3IDE2_HELAN|nr:hypothetical protein HanXRQr2_Chr08g0328661 [Helianthus annuus]KAJ0900787.1 hypothetical protein HanPSC8_Chr08g0317711 [Helianthus annuus]